MKDFRKNIGKERGIGSGLAGPFTTAASLIGTETFLKGTVKHKEQVHKLLQYSTDCVVKCCEDLHRKLGIGFTLSEPMGSRDLLSKRQFKEFFVPYIKQAVVAYEQISGLDCEFTYVDMPGIAGKKLLAQESVDFG